MQDYEKDFLKRTHEHIDRVNKYAEKIGLSFPNHDKDKFTTLYNGYSKMGDWKRDDLTPEEQKEVDEATYIHVSTNQHHPEYWADPEEIEGFTRQNPNPHGMINAEKMTEDAMQEMCADWCSMSEEFKNTPFEWFEKVNGKRWKFTKEQQDFILGTLNKMWKTEELTEDLEDTILYRGTRDENKIAKKDATTWLTTEYAYANKYSKYVYSAKIHPKNICDLGNTDKRVFGLRPIKPYKLSADGIKFFRAIGEMKPSNLIKEVLKECKAGGWITDSFDAYVFGLRIYTIVRTKVFKQYMLEKGYDCIKTVEEGTNVCYGVLDNNIIEWIDAKENLNESVTPFELEKEKDRIREAFLAGYEIGKKINK